MLLSYPDDNDANIVKLIDNSSDVMFEAKTSDTIFNPDDVKPFPAFNAYSKPGDYEVTAQELSPSKQIASIALNTYYFSFTHKKRKEKTHKTMDKGYDIYPIVCLILGRTCIYKLRLDCRH